MANKQTKWRTVGRTFSPIFRFTRVGQQLTGTFIGSRSIASTKYKGKETVFMSIRGPLAAILETIAGMKHVVEVESLAPEGTEQAGDDELHAIVVRAEKGKDVKEDLFRCVVENGWSLSELRAESITLEDVFKQLTCQEESV